MGTLEFPTCAGHAIGSDLESGIDSTNPCPWPGVVSVLGPWEWPETVLPFQESQTSTLGDCTRHIWQSMKKIT